MVTISCQNSILDMISASLVIKLLSEIDFENFLSLEIINLMKVNECNSKPMFLQRKSSSLVNIKYSLYLPFLVRV